MASKIQTHRARLASVLRAVLIGMLMAAAPLTSHAIKCVQNGSLPEEGAIECHASTIVEDLYSGPVGWSFDRGPCPYGSDAGQVEECLLDWATKFRSCFSRTELDHDWASWSVWGDSGMGPDGETTYRNRYREYRTYFRQVEFTADGQPQCTGAEYYETWGFSHRQKALCPPGHRFYDFARPEEGGDGSMMCGDPQPLQCVRIGHPIEVSAGAKVLDEAVFTRTHVSPLTLAWHYDSHRQNFVGLGISPSARGVPLLDIDDRVWRHDYDSTLVVDRNAHRPAVRIVRPGVTRDAYFVFDGGVWRASNYDRGRLEEWPDDPDVRWIYHDESERLWFYADNGRLVRIATVDGENHWLSYDDAGRLAVVNDDAGRALTFEYDANNHVATVTNSAGERAVFTYTPSGMLASIVFPDGSIRRYLYEAAYAHLLTGVIDELGVRVSTYAYDASQRPVSTQLVGGIDAYTVAYQDWNNNRPMRVTAFTGVSSEVVWAPVGDQISYWFYSPTAQAFGGLSQPLQGLDGWPKSAQADGHGNLVQWTDFSDRVTTSTYDLARNVPTQRTVAPGSPDARTTSFQWHPQWALPAAKAEPKRVTALVRHGETFQGRVVSCERDNATLAGKPLPVVCLAIEQPTRDATGAQGFAVAVEDGVNVTRATYRHGGKPEVVEQFIGLPASVLSDIDAALQPLTPDLRRTLTYYDDATETHYPGDPSSVTTESPSDGEGRVETETFDAYDKAGRVTALSSSDGINQRLAYTSRGQLKTHTVRTAAGNPALTAYAYDDSGQLLVATLADGSGVRFTYDQAHRLTQIGDSDGNGVTYALDTQGKTTGRSDAGAVAVLDARIAQLLSPAPAGPEQVSAGSAANRAIAAATLRETSTNRTSSPSLLADWLAAARNRVSHSECMAACTAGGIALGGVAGEVIGTGGGIVIGGVSTGGAGAWPLGVLGANAGGPLGALVGGGAGAGIGRLFCPMISDGKAPPLPDTLVGRPPNNQGGKRVNSDPLEEKYGGTGDPYKDFDILAGGTGKPADPADGRPAGTIVGDNGIAIRPGKGNDGPRIDIPANGNKPAETLHYPKHR